jgi:hypothetical protein
MIQCGARNIAAEAIKAFQSSRLCGEKILVCTGQLFLSLDLLAVRQLTHLINIPPVYVMPEAIATFLQTHPLGLPGFGFSDTLLAWQ